MATESPAPSDDRIYTDEHLGYELFWEKNKTRILLGGAGLIALVLAVVVWVSLDAARAAEARKAFALASSVDGWRGVIEKYPESVEAASASLLIAEALREGGDLKASTAEYEAFPKSPAARPMEGFSRIGLAENAAASGDVQGAISILREVSASGSGSTVQLALLLEGRLLGESGDAAAARKVIESLASQFPESLAARIARSQIEQLSVALPPAANPSGAPALTN